MEISKAVLLDYIKQLVNGLLELRPGTGSGKLIPIIVVPLQ